MYINEGIALVITFLAITSFGLGVIARKRTIDNFSRTTLAAFLVSTIALCVTGVFLLKMESDFITGRALSRYESGMLEARQTRFESSIGSISRKMEVFESDAKKKSAQFENDALQDHTQKIRIINRIDSLSAEVALLQLHATRDKSAQHYLKTFSGHYSVGRHGDIFSPCSIDGSFYSWAIRFTLGEARREEILKVITNAHIAPIPVNFTGVLSTEGKYNYVGMASYKRIFIVMDAEKRENESQCEFPWDGPRPDGWHMLFNE